MNGSKNIGSIDAKSLPQMQRTTKRRCVLRDSITEGGESDLVKSSQVSNCNRGISGDTTRGMLLRLNDDVLSLKPQRRNAHGHQ